MKPAWFDLLPRWQVIGSDGRTYGPFTTEARAALFATVRWPQQVRDFDFGGEGWSIQMIGATHGNKINQADTGSAESLF